MRGKQAEYFDFFYDVLAAHPKRIGAEARAEYARAYGTDGALTAGFNWYRAFRQDVQDNLAAGAPGSATPLLYLRGEREQVDIRQ